MTFLELYGDRLDHELGSADRTERFTLARRKAAVNLAQREFTRETDCFPRRSQIDLTTGISEYDLGVLVNDQAFFRFTDEQPFLKLTDANGNHTYLSGEDFQQIDVPLLDREEIGWRSASASSPSSWYFRSDGRFTYFGLYPTPSFTAGASGLAFVPYSSFPATMVADTDEPFQTATGGAPKYSLRAHHQALVHRAAAELEKLRRNNPQVREQLGFYSRFVRDYLEKKQPTGGTRISTARDYFRDAQRGSSQATSPDWWRR
jgi:hypothetical protein